MLTRTDIGRSVKCTILQSEIRFSPYEQLVSHLIRQELYIQNMSDPHPPTHRKHILSAGFFFFLYKNTTLVPSVHNKLRKEIIRNHHKTDGNNLNDFQNK